MGLINFPELIVNVKTVSEEIDHFTRLVRVILSLSSPHPPSL